MIHIHIASGSLTGCCYMTQSGTYEHQGTLAVGKCTDRFCTTFDFTVEALNRVIGPYPGPLLRRKIHIGQGFFNPVFYLLCSFGKLHGPEFLRYQDCFFTGGFLAFLRMDRLEHNRYRFHLITGCNRKDISVKMNRTVLISGIRKDFRKGFKHTEILIADDQTYTSKPAFFQPYEERTPAFTILFHPFRSSKDFPAAILTDANGNENRNILDLAAPTAFQVNTIYVIIGIVPGKRTGTPGFDILISLFIQVADGSGGYFCSP